MSNQWQTGQDLIKNPSGSSIAGFNMRISGHSYVDTFQYPHERTDGDRHGGWRLAEKLIDDGKIYFRHNFHNSHGGCSGFAFPYGGTWVCNTCQRSNLNDEWWKIKVYMDGNSWCCVGLGFDDLQASENYAFGNTREEAVKNYGDLMISPPKEQSHE